MEIFQLKYIDEFILRQSQVRLSITIVETLKWFGQEQTDVWMDKPNDKERMYMYFTCIACYCVTFTYKLKYCHNFWTACSIRKIFSTSSSGNPYIKHHYNSIKINEDMAFKIVDYAMSRKVEVLF